MIQFTGFLSNNNGSFYKDGFVLLLPHLTPFGNTALDCLIHNSQMEQIATLGYNYIPKEIFNAAEPNEGNHYDKMISALEAYVIADLQEKNPEVQFEVVPIPEQ